MACCRGLLASSDQIDGIFRDSLAHGPEIVGPFEYARTLLAYGRRLREVGRAPEAKEYLEDAFTRFFELGAEPWLAQARSELEACGAIPPDLRAGKYGTPEEAKALLEKAVVAIKEDKTKALDLFSRGEDGFRDRDLYVFCANARDGIITAHPYGIKGKQLREIFGKKGYSLGQEMMEKATEGEMKEVTYWWPRPGSDKPHRKTSLYTKVGDQICGVGYYKE